MKLEQTVDKTELQRMRADLRRMVTLVRGTLLRKTATLTIKQARRRFASRQSPDGQFWAPRKGPPAHPPLRKTGEMFRALRVEGSPGEYHAGIFEGSSVAARALAHHSGRPNMPARPFIGVGQRDDKMVATQIDAFVRMRFPR